VRDRHGFTKMGFTALNLIPQGPGEQVQVEQLAAEVLPAVRAPQLMRWAVYSQPTPSHPAGCKDRELSQARRGPLGADCGTDA
jgi:hypothetical protein